jgi:transmembrane sensor
MNSFPKCLDPAAEEQASLWAARLDGSVPSADDHNALEAWLAEAPAHRELLSYYCQFSTDLEQQLPALVESGAVELPPAPAPARSRTWLKWGLGVGLAAAALMLWLARPRTQSENLASPMAVRQTLNLADGTRVELNAQTNLQIEITRNGRRVRLASGEAFFAVHKEAARPFIVETPAGSVRVTGTQFDVRAETAAPLEVTVVEGSVQVRPADMAGRPGAPVLLGAGAQLSAGPSGVEVRALSATALDDALAWRQGQIVFADVPLRTALARFARYHGRGITATAAAAEMRVGGRYSLDDLDGFLASLEVEDVLPVPVRVTRSLDGTVQVSLRTEH